jgi:hypothetical protein
MLQGNTCAERSSNDDSPIYTVRYVVCASTLLPLSGPLVLELAMTTETFKLNLYSKRYFISRLSKLIPQE